MKKYLALISTLIILVIPAVNPEAKLGDYPESFGQGDMAIQAGAGVAPVGFYGKTEIPPVAVSFDMAAELSGLPFSVGTLARYASSILTIGRENDFFTNFGGASHVLVMAVIDAILYCLKDNQKGIRKSDKSEFLLSKYKI